MLSRIGMVLSFATLTILSCTNSYQSKEKKSFNSFDFTYACAVCLSFYSIKFSQNDTVFLRQYLPRIDHKNYYGVLSKSQEKKLDSLIDQINLEKTDSLYNTIHIDGDESQLYIEKDTIAKSISISGSKIPKELSDLSLWVKALKDSLQFYPTDTVIDFESLKKYSFLNY